MKFVSLVFLSVCACTAKGRGNGASRTQIAALKPEVVQMLFPDLADFLGILKFFNFSNPNVSTDCSQSFQILKKSLEAPFNATNMWALQMLDASGKLPSGLLMGGMFMYGSFDECMSIVAHPWFWRNLGVDLNTTIEGQYCPMSVKLNNQRSNSSGAASDLARAEEGPCDECGGPEAETGLDVLGVVILSMLRIDLCLPSTCTEEDIYKAFNNYIPVDLINATIEVGHCQTNEPVPFSGSQITSIVVFSILGMFVLAGTILDLVGRIKRRVRGSETTDNNSRVAVAFLSFSLYTNSIKLLNTNSSADNLSAINGIRFLSMSWVILGHCYSFASTLILGNLFIMKDLTANFALQAVLNGALSVDTFFFLSGLLVTYVLTKELKKKGTFNLGLFFFHRYWRLTPAILFLILFIIIWPRMLSGPLVANSLREKGFCETNWWVNLVYLQNFVRLHSFCAGHTWYLANDMQFYIISPLIIFALYKNRVLGLSLNGLFLLTSIITPAVIAHVNNYPPTMIFGGNAEDHQTDFMQDIYITPYCRMGPFCIGIYVGYFLAVKRTVNIKVVVCWCLSIACNMAVLYGVLPWNKGNVPERGPSDLYVAVSRTVWAMGVGWMTYACATGHGGIVNTILSWKPFIPLGRMTYVAYLIHPYLQHSFTAILRERIIYTHYLYVILFLGFLTMSYGVAFALSLVWEAPFLGLEKVLFRKIVPPRRTSTVFERPSTDLVDEGRKGGRVNGAFVDLGNI